MSNGNPKGLPFFYRVIKINFYVNLIAQLNFYVNFAIHI